MKIVVASGKGGTGKSMLASSMALLFSKNEWSPVTAMWTPPTSASGWE